MGAAAAVVRPGVAARRPARMVDAQRRCRLAGRPGRHGHGQVQGQAVSTRARPSGPRSPTSPASTRSRTRSPRSSTSCAIPASTAKLGAQIPHGVLLSGAAGHRQDAAGPGGRRRGERAVLLDLGLRVRRDDRRRRGQPGPRPVRAGQAGRPGRSSSSTSWTPSAGPAAARTSGGGNDEREQTLNQILTEMDGFTGSEGVVVLAATNRPEILDSGAAAPGPVRPAGHGDRAGPAPGGGRSSRCTPAACRWLPAWTWTPSPPRPPGMVGADLKNLVNEAALLAARRGHDQVTTPRLHRRAGEDRARHRPRDLLTPAGEGADRLPRVRPRPARHAHPRRRPGAQDLDHPPRPGARRHLPGARRRPLRLLGDLPARPDHRRARRPGRRGDRLRRRDHRRRERPGAGQQHRPADGRPMGHVRGDRAGLGAAPVRPGVPATAPTVSPRPPESSSTPKPAGSSRTATRRPLATLRGSRDQLDRLARTLLDRETLEEDEAYAAAGVSPGPAPAMTTRNQAPGTTPAPSAPPAAAQAGAAHVTPATSR